MNDRGGKQVQAENRDIDREWWTRRGNTTIPLATYVYSYDQANRTTSETDAEGTASFAYDSANELTTVTGSRSESYTYDLNGNRTGTGYSTTVMNETATSPGPTTYTYLCSGQYQTATFFNRAPHFIAPISLPQLARAA